MTDLLIDHLWDLATRPLHWLREHLVSWRPIRQAWVVVLTSEAARDEAREWAATTGQPQLYWEVRGMFRSEPAARRAAQRFNGFGASGDRTDVRWYRIAGIRPVNAGTVHWLESDYIHPRPGWTGP